MTISTASALLLSSQAVSTIGSTVTGFQAAGAQGEIERQSLRANQEFAEMQAEDAIERGRRQAQDYRRQVKALIGSQRARLAAQGISVSSGSALDVQTDTAALGAVDALTIRNNAFREAMGFRVEALNLRSGEQVSRIRQSQRRTNTVLTGGLRLAEIGLLGRRLAVSGQ